MQFQLNEKDLARFWSYVDKQGPEVIPGSPCWVWNGRLQPNGYAQFRFGPADARQRLYVHRASYLLAHGEIPDSLHVLHKCDVRRCIRQNHLYAGTEADNGRDRMIRKRLPSGDAHWARRNPGQARPPHFSGEQHPRAVLTDDAAQAIRVRFADGGLTQVALSREYGVSTATVNRIVNGLRGFSSYEYRKRRVMTRPPPGGLPSSGPIAGASALPSSRTDRCWRSKP